MFSRLFTMFYASLVLKISCQLNPPQLINKLFNRPAQESVSKFPPVVEFIVQKIQSQYSNYVHEDLSRPPTWNKPVYTLSPQDQLFFSAASTTPNTSTVREDDFEYIDTDNTTEIFFEIIANNDKNDLISQNSISKPINPDKTTEKLFEIINTTEYPRNKTFVYITPKKPSSTTPIPEIEKTNKSKDIL